LLSAKATTLSPSNPTKASNYVYLTGAIDTQVCVVDATGKKTPLQVVKNQGVSVYGKAPWQLAGADLAKLQIYFQGWRVNLSDTSTQKLVLVEQGSNP
jgi:nitrous oxidase accessory protein NosD